MARGSVRSIIPLLHVLRSVNSDYRIIILSHLDDLTRDRIYEALTKVLTNDKLSFSQKLELKKKLGKHRHDLRCLMDTRKSAKVKKKKLLQMGGGPMSNVLSATFSHLLDQCR